jgi:hypothetical protein
MDVDGVHGDQVTSAGYRLRVAGANATRPTLAGFPLRYREETSIIILESRTNGKS